MLSASADSIGLGVTGSVNASLYLRQSSPVIARCSCCHPGSIPIAQSQLRRNPQSGLAVSAKAARPRELPRPLRKQPLLSIASTALCLDAHHLGQRMPDCQELASRLGDVGCRDLALPLLDGHVGSGFLVQSLSPMGLMTKGNNDTNRSKIGQAAGTVRTQRHLAGNARPQPAIASSILISTVQVDEHSVLNKWRNPCAARNTMAIISSRCRANASASGQGGFRPPRAHSPIAQHRPEEPYLVATGE